MQPRDTCLRGSRGADGVARVCAEEKRARPGCPLARAAQLAELGLGFRHSRAFLSLEFHLRAFSSLEFLVLFP